MAESPPVAEQKRPKKRKKRKSPYVWTPPEVGIRWRCKPEGVRALLESGALRGFRVGKHWRITLDALLEYEQGQPTAAKLQRRRRRNRERQLPEGPF